jgi:hypothetical protein
MNPSSHLRHLLLGACLALAALAPAALRGAAQAAAPPALGPLQITAFGTYATIALTSAEPVAVSIDYKPASASAMPDPAPSPSTAPPIAIGDGQFHATYTYAARHELKLTGLKTGTAYAVAITARTQDNRTATAQGSFTTLSKRIRVVLESIEIEDDGDGILAGKGEPSWFMYFGWTGRTNPLWFCHPLPSCYNESFGEGRITPRNAEGKPLMLLFAEENFDRFPELLSIAIEAKETDLVDGAVIRPIECLSSIFDGGCLVGEAAPTTWGVPQGVEGASQTLRVRGDDKNSGLESVLTFRVDLFHAGVPAPSPRRNMPSTTWRPY